MEKSGRKWEKKAGKMLIGTYHHSLDEKNRLSIPKKFRETLGGMVVVTRGLDGCLFIYGKTDWENIEAKIMETPLTKADARGFSRLILSGACEETLDKLGRIIMPEYLREFAGIKTETAILGVGDRLEVWAKEKWESYQKDLTANSDQIAERLSEMGI